MFNAALFHGVNAGFEGEETYGAYFELGFVLVDFTAILGTLTATVESFATMDVVNVELV